ncbi:uncharacterized protein GGS22DRAFT_197660 [Annulohypoxylon maeteangense]|uniref:uncharacterized protein n=1 Tax=Annulohypoxylon maeteangense TaxID=1927788 RepID=UPI002008D6AD|nr:uncharacterized protein GGS22DRAFT_197660 [Annulohypoxylon maeteangense]KAI0880234.1 hypothetical protein GGS22DRAFT_197660 [Annulohypoxylon maeteangense]
MSSIPTVQKATFADSKETFQATLMSLFSGKPEDTEADISKIFTPTATLRDDNTTLDFSGLVEHFTFLRRILPRVTLTVEQFVRDGVQLADRHSSSTVMQDGTVKRAETFMFVVLGMDGRIESIIETVRQLV